MGRYFVALKPIGTMPRGRTQPVVAEWRAGAGAGGRDAPPLLPVAHGHGSDSR